MVEMAIHSTPTSSSVYLMAIIMRKSEWTLIHKHYLQLYNFKCGAMRGLIHVEGGPCIWVKVQEL